MCVYCLVKGKTIKQQDGDALQDLNNDVGGVLFVVVWLLLLFGFDYFVGFFFFGFLFVF